MRHYRYCPYCGKKLHLKTERGNEPLKLSCQACSFVYYDNPVPTASALILRNDKLLFTLRKREPKKDYWDLPGGFIESGEHPESAIKRELLEELSVKAKNIRYFGVYIDKYYYKTGHSSTLNIYYLVEITGKIKARDDVSQAKWFTAKNPPKKIAFPHIYKILYDLKK